MLLSATLTLAAITATCCLRGPSKRAVSTMSAGASCNASAGASAVVSVLTRGILRLAGRKIRQDRAGGHASFLYAPAS